MFRKKLVQAGLSAAFFFSVCHLAYAATDPDLFRYPFYVGVEGGYGSTTWGWLVPPENRASELLELSTPTNVNEGGALWGIFMGYELIPEFAVEANYSRYTTAHVFFSDESIFAFTYDGQTQFNSGTEDYSLSAKFMLFIPQTTVRVYSSVGVAAVHRYDILEDRWRASPAFGVGFNYNITPHWMTEIGANFTGGYGESELTPANDYMPFLYSVFLRLAYRF